MKKKIIKTTQPKPTSGVLKGLLNILKNPTFQQLHREFPDLVKRLPENRGPQHRWKKIIPVGAKLRRQTTIWPGVGHGSYDGNGYVLDVKTCNRYKCSKWSDHVVVPDGGIQDVVVILQRNSGQMIEVPLIAFNYYTLENLIEPHGVFSWVFHEATGENCWLADFDTNLSSIPMDCSEDGVTAEMSLPTLYQDDIKTDLTTSPQEMGKSHYFSPMPSAPEAVNAIYMEIPVAYNSFSLAGKEIRVTPSEELQSWRRTYGIKDSAKCIICGINRINRTGPACNKGHVNPKCRGGLGYAVWTFIFQCAECNQVGKRTENTFDQLVERGRNDIILVCSHILFDLYCAAEARLNVEFGGLADFIEKVYGRYSAKSRGGIKNESVFQLLHQEDVTHPMPPEMRNPFLRARSKVERHYYKMLQTQEEMLIKS